MQPKTENRIWTYQDYWTLPYIRTQIESSARTTNGTYKINQEVIKNIKIPVPPIELQNQFTVQVQRAEALKTKFKKSYEEIDQLFNSLMHYAFKGQLEISDNLLEEPKELCTV